MRDARSSSGFSLLELLIVVAILAVIGGAALLQFHGTQDDAELTTARRELLTIREAVLAFRRDTGYWPRRGPFALTSDGGQLDAGNPDHWPSFAPASAGDRELWFLAPANLYMLFESSDAPSFQAALDVIAGPGRIWNPETRRGYRGPYLARHSEGFVYVGGQLTQDGEGDPASGSPLGTPVPGVADPWGGWARDDDLYQWVGTPLSAPSQSAPAPLGRPYLLFSARGGDLPARILCLGPNGHYDSSDEDINALPGGDDLVVFLED